MSTSSSISHYGVLQRVALAAGSALVRWAEQTAASTAAVGCDAETRARRAEQRRQAEERRERIITNAHLMPRQF